MSITPEPPPQALLAELARRGVEVWAEEGRLRYRAPRGALTAELRSGLAEHKAAILARLAATGAAAAVVPDPAARYEPFPLTSMQEAYWVGRGGAFDLGNVACHAYLEFDSRLDPERLEASWQRLVERHDMLRAVVEPEGRQRVLREVPPYAFPVVDLKGWEPAAAAAQLLALRRELSHQVLAPERWPLFDLRVTRLGGSRIRLHFGIDLLVADAWSILLLLREWARLYERPGAHLPELGLTFRDCVLARQAGRDTPAYRRARDYWLARLPELPPAPRLPLAARDRAGERPHFERRTGRLAPEAWQRLKARAAAAGLTPSSVLCAAFAEALGAYCDAPRFSLNLTLFQRLLDHPEIGAVVGDFTATLPLAVEAMGGPFAARARRLHEQLLRDLDHLAMDGIEVLREVGRQRGDPLAAVLPVVFTSLLAERYEGEIAPLAWLGERVYGISQTPQVWLDHQLFEEEGALVYHWDALEGRFPAGLIADLFDSYGAVLARLSAEPARWDETAAADLVPAAQRARRQAVNATAAPPARERLEELFAATARQRPAAAAVISVQGALTYAELQQAAARLAARLRRRGAGAEELVAVVLDPGWEQAAATLGILAAGAAYLPLDPGLPPARLAWLLADAEARWAVTTPRLDRALAWPAGVERLCLGEEEEERPDAEAERRAGDVSGALSGGEPGPDAGAEREAGALSAAEPGAAGQAEPLAGAVAAGEPVEPQGRAATAGAAAAGCGALAYVIYTSGSTGLPKGVMVDHRAAVNTVLDINRRFAVGPRDRVLALSALSFDLSVYDLFGVLGAGGALVVPDPASRRDPAQLAALLRREAVTIWNSVPALMEMLVDYLAGRGETLPASLRLVLLSGDWIPLTLPERIWRLAPGARVVSLGGATEAAIWSVIHPVERVDPAWRSIPYGLPLTNQTWHVLDDRLAACPDWVAGELHIGGLGLARGYWRDPEKTALAFRPHPETGERLYRTGDLGRFLPDGELELLGRRDLQVKIQGYRVELGEVEAAVAQHPAVRLAAAAVVGEAPGERRLAAYVVGRQGQTLDLAELRRFTAARLPDYMVPVLWTALDALPLSANGKVDRRALPPPAALGAPAASGAVPGVAISAAVPGLADAAAAPGLASRAMAHSLADPGGARASTSPVARPAAPAARQTMAPAAARIAELIAAVLGIERLDPEANLFDLGATSVQLVRILNRLEQETGVRPPIQELYRQPTAASLTRAVSSRGGPGWAAAPAVAAALGAAAAPGAGGVAWGELLPAEGREAFQRERHGLRRGDEGRPRIDLGAVTAAAVTTTTAGVAHHGAEAAGVVAATTASALAASLPAASTAIAGHLHRRSHRRFRLAPVPAAALAALLGSLRELVIDGRPKYRYGSAGGLYPVQTYLYVKPGRVAGVTQGTYYYHPVEHALVALVPGAALDRGIYDPFVGRPVFDEAAFALFLVAQLRAVAPLYGELAPLYAAIESGLIAQLLESDAPAAGLGLCQIGGVDFARVRDRFALDDGHLLIHSLVGGRVAGGDQGDELGGAAASAGEATPGERLLDRVAELAPAEVAALLAAEKGPQ